MTIYFGLALDDVSYPLPTTTVGGVDYCGLQKLILILESHLGIIGHPPENEYLRIEQYRQALAVHLKGNPTAFFKASFEADQFATAAKLLAMRDELLLAGCNLANLQGVPDLEELVQKDAAHFTSLPHPAPNRLTCLAEIEKLFESPDRTLAFGFADRFIAVLQHLGNRQQPIQEIHLVEPFELLPSHFQKLLKKLELLGATLHQLETKLPEGESDLALFQKI